LNIFPRTYVAFMKPIPWTCFRVFVSVRFQKSSDESILYICIEVEIVGKGGLKIVFRRYGDIGELNCCVYETETVGSFPCFCFCSLPSW